MYFSLNHSCAVTLKIQLDPAMSMEAHTWGVRGGSPRLGGLWNE